MAERGRAIGSLRRVARSLGSGRRETGIALVAYGVYSLVRGVFGGTVEAGRANAGAPHRPRRPARDPGRTGSPEGLHRPPPRDAVLELLLPGQPGHRPAAHPHPRLPVPAPCVPLAAEPGNPVVVRGARLVRRATGRAAAFGRFAHGHRQPPDVHRPRQPAHHGLLQPGRRHAEPARRVGARRGLGALAADKVTVDPRRGAPVPVPRRDRDRRDRQPLRPRHRRGPCSRTACGDHRPGLDGFTRCRRGPAIPRRPRCPSPAPTNPPNPASMDGADVDVP